MRKAKDIAKEANEKIAMAATDEEVNRIIHGVFSEFLRDVSEIQANRKINIERNPRGYFHIFKEVNDKWNALCRRSEYFKVDGFKSYLCSPNSSFRELNLDVYWKMYIDN